MEPRGRLITGVLALAVAIAACGSVAHGAAVTYQGDAAHTGYVDAPLAPPLGKKWIRRGLGSHVSYPVMGDGKVFVTAASSSSGSERTLYALDRRTGGTVWTRPVAGSALAFDGGRVFVAGGGKLQAYSSATGQSQWLLEPAAIATPPVADGTTVFASSETSAGSYEELTGARAASSTSGGEMSGVALDGPRVYTANGCVVSMYTKGLGEPAWTYGGTACGSGAFAPAVFGGRVWARSSNGSGVVIDQNLGLKTDGFTSYGAPAFRDNLAYFSAGSQIQARHVDTGTSAWSYQAPTSFHSSPLVVRGVLYALTSDDHLAALDAGTGAERWTGDLRGRPDESGSSYSSSEATDDGMAADSTGLIVPSGSRITALGPGPDAPGVSDADKYPAAATKLTARAGRKTVDYPGKVSVSGDVSRSGQTTSDQLELQASTYPYDVWRTVRRGRASYGRYSLSAAPDRNTHYRVVDIDTAPAVTSKTMNVVVFLGGGVHYYDAGRTRLRVDARIVAPPFLQLAKRPLYVYRLRSRRSHPVRIGHLTVRPTGGPHYRARGKVRVPSLRRRDLFYACVPIRQWREIGRFGRRDRCGAKRL